MLAASWNNEEALVKLLATDADPEETDSQGCNAIMYTAEHASLEVLDHLVNLETRFTLTDHEGETVLDYAK